MYDKIISGKLKITFTIIAALFILQQICRAQDTIYMPFFELINMHSDYRYSSAKLFKTYVDEAGKYSMVLPEKNDTVVDPSSYEQTKKHSRELNADYFILGEMNRVGETVIIAVKLFRTGDGVEIWNDKLKASGPDDLDPIMQKIARALGTKQKAAEDGDIYSVTVYESKELNKIKAGLYLGGAIGGAIPFTTGSGNILPGLKLFVSNDARNMIIDVSGQVYFQNNINFFILSTETFYPLKSNKKTFYMGGGLAYSNIDHEQGLMLLAGGGLMFNRHSTVVLRLSGKSFVGLYEADNTIPVGLLLNMEILINSP